MDDKEKSIFESVTDTIRNTFEIATEAAKKAMEPEPLHPDEEVVMIPAREVSDPMSPMPPLAVVVKRKPRKNSAIDTSGRTTPTYDIPVPDTPLPASKKTAKKASSKPAKKPVKKAGTKSKSKNAVKKSTATKSAGKTARKSKTKFAAKNATTKKGAKKKKAKKSNRR